MIDDQRLDTLLRSSGEGRQTSEDLFADNERILREARSGRLSRARKWGAVAGIPAVLVAGSSAAMAGSGLETPWGWIADNVFQTSNPDSSICFQGMRISFTGLSPDAPIVLDAQEILQGIDVEALDTTETERDLAWEASEANPGQVGPEGLKQSAVGAMVAEILFDELAARGYDLNPSPISLEAQTEGCDP